VRNTAIHLKITVSSDGRGLVSQAGAVLDGPAQRREPKRLRLRLFSAAGRIIHGGRRLRLRLAATWPWASHITAAITRLQSFAPG